MKELIEIQKNLKAAKDEKNLFGNYNYRTCEGILEAVKPLLGECRLILADEMIQIGDRYYLKATAALNINGDIIASTGWARECQTKKGMDEAQITGAASSYARKYALCGLFLIDGGEDPDKGNNSKEVQKAKKKEPLEIEQELSTRITKFFNELRGDEESVKRLIQKWKDYLNEFNFSKKEIKDNIKNHFKRREEIYNKGDER